MSSGINHVLATYKTSTSTGYKSLIWESNEISDLLETHRRMETSKPNTFSYMLISLGKYSSSNEVYI